MSLAVLTASLALSMEGYTLVPNMTLPWVTKSVQSASLAAAKVACDADVACSAFTSDAVLKYCNGGRCTCEISPNSCPEPPSSSSTNLSSDLYIKTNFSVPPALHEGIANSTIFYDGLTSLHPASLCYQPEIGNGYIATNVDWDAMYISGLYNGKCGSVHKARIPSFIRIDVTNGTVIESWLDVREAIFYKKWALHGGVVEQSFYADRVNRHQIVMRLKSDIDLKIDLIDRLNLNSTNLADAPGNKCAGSFTSDFKWNETKTANYSDYNGKLTLANDGGDVFSLRVRRDVVGAVSLKANQFSVLKTTFVTDLTDDTKAPIAALHTLSPFASHLAALSDLQRSGIELIAPTPTNASLLLNGVGLNFRTAETITRQINSSLYFLRSSLREDWTHGISPGGISTQNYQGAVFFDMDTYMSGALFLLNQNLSRSCLQYRFHSLNTSREIATLFGYKGAQFAWTSAYQGAPFGCCSGHGSYEDCLEQHITGDIGVAAWQFFAASNDTEWLRSVGHPLLDGIKDWVLSRGTSTYGANQTLERFDINGILPVDEWCVGSGCGCETPGVSNDAQTNAVLKLSLECYLKSADALNITLPDGEYSKITDIAAKIPILFNTTHNRHNQFTSPSCPNGFGGDHYGDRHTVCPDDVMYLSYPFGDLLGTTEETTKNDYDFFVPVTCKENSGMTTPVHAVSQLTLKGADLFAQEAFDEEFFRSLHAGVYGPFNVRNEVDKHPNVVGAHFDNTHFLTGDGGFLHIFVAGFAGLRLLGDGLVLRRPSYPDVSSGLRVRGLQWRAYVLDFEVNEMTSTIAIKGEGGDPLCVADAKGKVVPFVSGVVVLEVGSFVYPGLVKGC